MCCVIWTGILGFCLRGDEALDASQGGHVNAPGDLVRPSNNISLESTSWRRLLLAAFPPLLLRIQDTSLESDRGSLGLSADFAAGTVSQDAVLAARDNEGTNQRLCLSVRGVVPACVQKSGAAS